jgi:hypothetical protein
MTTYKIKKEFTPMDFYDYVKSQGREKCKEFKKDFGSWTTEVGIFCPYAHGVAQTKLDKMLSERANFRRYMIEGGFVEEEKKEVKCTIHENTDYYKIDLKGQGEISWNLARIYKNNGRIELYSAINDPSIRTDADGYIEVIKGNL